VNAYGTEDRELAPSKDTKTQLSHPELLWSPPSLIFCIYWMLFSWEWRGQNVKSSPIGPIVSQLNPAHTLTP